MSLFFIILFWFWFAINWINVINLPQSNLFCPVVMLSPDKTHDFHYILSPLTSWGELMERLWWGSGNQSRSTNHTHLSKSGLIGMKTQSLKKKKKSLSGSIELDFGTIRSLNLSQFGDSLNFCFLLFVFSFTNVLVWENFVFLYFCSLYIFNKGKNEKILRN